MTKTRDLSDFLIEGGADLPLGKPHIVPDVLYPAVEGKTLSDGTTAPHGSTYTYGTTINDGTVQSITIPISKVANLSKTLESAHILDHRV